MQQRLLFSFMLLQAVTLMSCMGPVNSFWREQLDLNNPSKRIDGAGGYWAPALYWMIETSGTNQEIEALITKHPETVNEVDCCLETPLSRAAFHNKEAVVLLLLKHGADATKVDDSGHTPLFFCWNLEICRQLLRAGTDPNKQNDRGDTALHRSYRDGHSDKTALLLASGARPDIKNNDGKVASDMGQRSSRCQAMADASADE